MWEVERKRAIHKKSKRKKRGEGKEKKAIPGPKRVLFNLEST